MKNKFIDFFLKRRSITAKKMRSSTIKKEDLENILKSGIRVPDHGALSPWKLIVFKDDARKTFGEVLKNSFLKSSPSASSEEIAFEKNRFMRASVVICVLSCPVKHKSIPVWEMQLSSAAVCMNLLTSAQSMGYAAQWLTEWYAYDKDVLNALGINDSSQKVSGFIYVGEKINDPIERVRPNMSNLTSFWKN